MLPTLIGWDALDAGFPILGAGAFLSLTYFGSVVGPARPLSSFASFQLELPFSRAAVLWPGVAICNAFALAMAVMLALMGAQRLPDGQFSSLSLALGSATFAKMLTTHWLWGQCHDGFRRWALPIVTATVLVVGCWFVFSSGTGSILDLLASSSVAIFLGILVLVLCTVDLWILHGCDVHSMLRRSQQSSVSYAFFYTGNFFDATASLRIRPNVLRKLPILSFPFGLSLPARLLRTPARSAIGALWLTVLIVLFAATQRTAIVDPVMGTLLLLGIYGGSGIFFDGPRSEIEAGGSHSPYAQQTVKRFIASYLQAAAFLLIFALVITLMSSLNPMSMTVPLLVVLAVRLFDMPKTRLGNADVSQVMSSGHEMGSFLLVWRSIDGYIYFSALTFIYLNGGPIFILICILGCGLLVWRGITRAIKIG